MSRRTVTFVFAPLFLAALLIRCVLAAKYIDITTGFYTASVPARLPELFGGLTLAAALWSAAGRFMDRAKYPKYTLNAPARRPRFYTCAVYSVMGGASAVYGISEAYGMTKSGDAKLDLARLAVTALAFFSAVFFFSLIPLKPGAPVPVGVTVLSFGAVIFVMMRLTVMFVSEIPVIALSNSILYMLSLCSQMLMLLAVSKSLVGAGSAKSIFDFSLLTILTSGLYAVPEVFAAFTRPKNTLALPAAELLMHLAAALFAVYNISAAFADSDVTPPEKSGDAVPE